MEPTAMKIFKTGTAKNNPRSELKIRKIKKDKDFYMTINVFTSSISFHTEDSYSL